MHLDNVQMCIRDSFRAVFARLLPSSALLRMRILLNEEMAVSLAEKNAEQATRRTIAM